MTRATGGLLAVAALAFAGLLLAYVLVLEDGMRQGEMRRNAWAEQARTAWRCNTLPLDVERKECLGAIPALSDTGSASGLPAPAW